MTTRGYKVMKLVIACRVCLAAITPSFCSSNIFAVS
jgi:hypothetical protein